MLTSICTSKVYKKKRYSKRPILLFFTFHCSEVLPRLIKMTYCKLLLTSTGQTLRGALAAGREKEGELATTSLEFEFHLQFPCGSPSTELSDFRQSARSRDEHECKQALKNTCQG